MPKKSKTPRAPVTPGNKHNLKIQEVAYGGDGVARLPDGKIVFVPFAIAGEEVTVEIVEEKRDYARGKIQAILTPSPSRVEARCPHFGVCGGCELQHMVYEEQVRVKQAQSHRALNTLQPDPPLWLEAQGAQQMWNYRQRVQLHHRDKRWGFFKSKSHEVVAIDQCPIADPKLLKEFGHFNKNLPSSVEDVELITGPAEKDPVLLWFDGRGLKTEVVREVGGFRMRTSGDAFVQIHAAQNEKLVNAVTALAMGLRLEGTMVWDLYAGNGNFSLPLSQGCQTVVSVEENPLSSADAKYNAAQNARGNVVCIQGDTHRVWKDLLQKYPSPALIVLDPPRAGAKDLLPLITALNPLPHLIYVACELPSLRRDAKTLLQTGYRMASVQVLDLFPQTAHFETVMLLSPGAGLVAQ